MIEEINNMSNEDIANDLVNINNSKLLLGLLFSKDFEGINELCRRLSIFDTILLNKVKTQICKSLSNIKEQNNMDNDDIGFFENIEYPNFPIEALPSNLKEFALSVAESVQVSVDMPAVGMLAVLATCLQGKFRVEVKNDWIEPLSLYCTIIASPAERKSAVMSLITTPISDYENNENMLLKPLIIENAIEKNKLEKQKENYMKDKNVKTNIKDIVSELANFEDIKEVKIFADDVTPERLSSLISENNGKMSILSSEGGIFDIMAGKYSNTVNIDAFLKGHCGDTLKVDRIGRNSETIYNPHLTVLLAIQPIVLDNIMNNQTFRGRGLIARFLMCNGKSLIGERKFNTIPIKEEIKNNYSELVKNLLRNTENEKLIYFSNDAREVLELFYNEMEQGIKYQFCGIADFIGKIAGNTARIATLLQLVENIKSEYVEVKNVKSAIDIARYFIKNEENIFLYSDINDNIKNSKLILNYLNDKHIIVFTPRIIQRGIRKFKNINEINDALLELIDRKYIIFSVDLKKYIMNPKLFE